MTSSRPDTPLDDFADGAGQRAAEALETAFERAGNRIEQALGRAARSGEADFSRMTEAILADLARLAAQQVIERPLAGLVDRALGAITPDGARAEGGPVQPGGAYLVGERGPELFTPGVAGQVSPAGKGGSQTVHIHLTLPPGYSDNGERAIAQSRSRIARSLARAVDEGRRWS